MSTSQAEKGNIKSKEPQISGKHRLVEQDGNRGSQEPEQEHHAAARRKMQSHHSSSDRPPVFCFGNKFKCRASENGYARVNNP